MSDTKTLQSQLQAVLDRSYNLLQRTQVYHWNVRGPMFFALHAAFEEQYRELFDAVDEIAERIVTLGGQPVLARIHGEADPGLDAQGMLQDLIAGHDATVGALRTAMDKAEAAGDEVSVDLALGRIAVHEKTIWMLRSAL